MSSTQLINKLTIAGSKAFWDKNPNQNSWTLELPCSKLGNKFGQDRYGTLIFGWVDEVSEHWPENAGRFKAGHPYTPPDIDEDSEDWHDAIDIGYFDTIFEAFEAVLNANHPEWGTFC